MTKLTGYHGTVWERPLIPSEQGFRESMLFHQLNPQASELESVFFCDQEKVAQFFSGLRVVDDENQIQAILRGTVDIGNVHQISIGGQGSAEWDGIHYHIPEHRLDFYHAVRSAGFDGVMIVDDYQTRLGAGHDIAIFTESAFRIEEAKLKIGDKWTPWLSADTALALFKRWSNDQEMGADLRNGREISFG